MYYYIMRGHLLLRILCFIRLLLITDAAKILVYCPSISKSHVLLCAKYADLLHESQHETVLFIPSYVTSLDSFNGGLKNAKLWRLTNISHEFENAFDEFDGVLEYSRVSLLERMRLDQKFWVPMCEALVNQRHRMQHLIDYKFDLAVIGEVDLCNFAVVRLLGIERTILLSTEPIMDKVGWDLGLPFPSSYVPATEENPNHDRMTVFERIHNMYAYFAAIMMHYSLNHHINKIFQNAVDVNFPTPSELIRNASLVFVNSNEMFDIARPISSKIIYVGLLEDEHRTILPDKLEKIFNKGVNGSIFVSFGTVAPFNQLPDNVKMSLLNAVTQLKHFHFVLKVLEEDETTRVLFANVTNIDLVHWVPQNAVLKHKNLKLFVSHGGMNSVLEAMTYSVPMILMPVFTDQFRNAKNVERRGSGEMIERKDIVKDTFVKLISKITEDESYYVNVRRVAKLIERRPFSSRDRVLKWTNFVLNNEGFTNFNLESNHLTFIQYYYVDLLLATVFVIVSVRWAFSKMFASH